MQHKHDSRSRYTNYLIMAIVIVMIAIACRFIFIVETPLINHISFRETVCGMVLRPYYDKKEDIYYLFLPSYVSPDEVDVTSSDFVTTNFSDEIKDYGNNLHDIPFEENIILTLTNFQQKEKYNIQIWQCENLSTMYLKSLSGSLDDVNADKEYELDTSVKIISPDGLIELDEALSTLSGRGNGSWSTNGRKNPYSLKFSSTVDFGSFESVKNICMLANYSDESRIRNAICYYAGDNLGIPYASPYMAVDVYVDGEYIGLYGLTTKDEYKKFIDNDGISAVFEMKVSNTSQDEESFNSKFSSRVNVMYGDPDEIQEAVGQLETALRTQDWDLCHQVIDLHSFAQRYIFEEFIANQDLAYGSSYESKYFYLDKDGTIYCMLPWDYDWTFGSAISYFNNLQVYELKAYRTSNNWWVYLLGDGKFIDEILNILNEEFTDEYLDNLCQYVDDITEEIDASWQCEIRRWKDEPQYSTLKNTFGISDMEGFAGYFNNYIFKRRDFLIDCFSDYNNYCRLELCATGASTEYFNLVVPKGTDIWSYMEDANILDTSRRSNYEFSGWYTDDGVSLYDIDDLTENMTFIGTWEKIEIQTIDSSAIATSGSSKTVESSEASSSVISIINSSSFYKNNIVIRGLRKIYKILGLKSFGWFRLILCGIFGAIFLWMICREILRWIRQRRLERWKNS